MVWALSICSYSQSHPGASQACPKLNTLEPTWLIPQLV